MSLSDDRSPIDPPTGVDPSTRAEAPQQVVQSAIDSVMTGFRNLTSMLFDADSFDPGITVFLSGGGFRSALSAVGAILYLVKTDRWKNVRCVASVSGGTFTNMVLAGIGSTDPTDALRGLLGRLSSNPPLSKMKRTMAGIAMVVIGTGCALYAGQKLRHAPFRVPPVATATIAAWCLTVFIASFRARETVRAHIVGLFVAQMVVVLGSWSSLRFPGIAVLLLGVGGFFTLATAAFFLLDLYMTERIRYILGSTPPSWNAMDTGGRVHLFAMSDTHYGTPVYLAVRDFHQRTFRAIDASNQTVDEVAALQEISLTDLSPFSTVIASVALPGVEAPVRRRSGEHTFRLSDGGLHGTLTSRLDPFVNQDPNGTSGDLAFLAQAAGGTVGVHSVVVDAGKFLGADWWGKLAVVPVLGRLVDIFRALLISLDSLITVDRREVVNETKITSGTHWYLRTTGASIPDRLTHPDLVGDRTLVKDFARRSNMQESAESILELRKRADRVGIFSGFKQWGIDCARVGALCAWRVDGRTPTDEAHPRTVAEFNAWFDAIVGGRPVPNRSSSLRTPANDLSDDVGYPISPSADSL